MSEGIYTIEVVTPQQASVWLADHNTHNIPLDDRLATSYAADMKAGRWKETGDAYKFAKDGTVLDGQKRMMAQVISGVTLELLVIRDLDMASQEVMDIGHRRNLSDVLHLRGEVQAVVLAGVLRRVYGWTQTDFRSYAEAGGNQGFDRPVTPYELLAYLEQMKERPGWQEGEPALDQKPGLREAARHASRIGSRLTLPASTVGLLWWLFEQLDHEDNTVFWTDLVVGANLAANSPIFQLRKHLEQDRKNVGKHETKALQMAFIIKSWNLWREGATVGLLKIITGGAHPEPYPEPH